MEILRILLVDLTQYKSEISLVTALERRYQLERTRGTELLDQAVSRYGPHVLIFEYDYPDIPSLTALPEIKNRNPSLPIIMVTEQHSEALAVWALRARVWNYFSKPTPVDALLESIGMLQRLLLSGETDLSRAQILPPPPIPEEARFREPAAPALDLAAALDYIDNHLSEKIPQREVARRCGLNSYQLSRAFKRRFGITFQEYVLQRRIEKAKSLLRNRSATITDVCWAVGFKDPSYFCRTFRRYSGRSPSEFRREWRSQRSKIEATSGT
jgi:AraC-like DNA-binding protein/ActR/RegA family two-component response regulator